MAQYPALKVCIRSVASRILSNLLEGNANKMTELLSREKDAFTMNDILRVKVNNFKMERFDQALNMCFENAKTPASDWIGLKEEVYGSMRQWYRNTHRYYF